MAMPGKPVCPAHPDDLAVEAFAALMKARLAENRAMGRSGWDDPALCATWQLEDMAQAAAERFDHLDASILSMMAYLRRNWCSVMERPKALCGCPDCGSSLVQVDPLVIAEALAGSRVPDPTLVDLQGWGELASAATPEPDTPSNRPAPSR